MLFDSQKAGMFESPTLEPDINDVTGDPVSGNGGDQVVRNVTKKPSFDYKRPSLQRPSITAVSQPPASKPSQPKGTFTDESIPEDEVCEFCEKYRPVGILIAVLAVLFFTLRG